MMEPLPEPYGIHSRDYLKRARRRLDENTSESLFYAAFELRCGIEARLREYLDVQEAVSEKKKSGWKIAQLAKDLERVFDVGDKAVKISIYSRDRRDLLYEFLYTPVTSGLRKKGQQLGDHLHASKSYHCPDDSWWRELRELLEATYRDLERANSGTMIGVPLREPGTSKVRFFTEVPPGGRDAVLEKIGGVGASSYLQVTYL